MNNDRLDLKGLINIGVFAVIYFMMMWVVGMPLGVLVVTYTFYPAAFAFVTGIITMFFMAKVQQKWAVFIFAFLPWGLMNLMGHTYVVSVHGLIVALAAEFVHRKYGFKSLKGNIITHTIMSLGTVGAFWQIYLVRDFYYNMTVSMIGEEYAAQLVSLPLWVMLAMYISVIILGYFGGKVGAKMLKKHFKRAGIV